MDQSEVTIPFYKENIKQAILGIPVIGALLLGIIFFLVQDNLNVSLNGVFGAPYFWLTFLVSRIAGFIFHGKAHERKRFFLECTITISIFLFLYFINPRLAPSSGFSSLGLLFITLGMVRTFLYALFGWCMMGFFYYVFILFSKNPAARLDEHGIWIKHFGYIPWNDIEEVALERKWNGVVKGVGIRLKNASSIKAQSDLVGKYALSWNKFYGSYHIILAHIATPYDDVISYAHQCMNTK